MIYGFQFMGKRPESINPNLLVDSRDIGFPKKNKITGSVPFSNDEYDFSEIYGSQIYENRTIKYVIHILNIDKLDPVEMHNLKTQLVNWLETSHGRQQLMDDVLPGYHFMGEVRDAASLADDFETGELTVNFDCYPFMIKDKVEGDDVWDTFDFETDIAQITEFNIEDSASIILINNGASVAYPEMDATDDLTIQVNGISYEVPSGKSNDLELRIGENQLIIIGTGHLSLTWHKEVI